MEQVNIRDNWYYSIRPDSWPTCSRPRPKKQGISADLHMRAVNGGGIYPKSSTPFKAIVQVLGVCDQHG